MKYALFILTQNDITAADFTELFFKHVECCFNFSRSIMINKNSHIISNFWWEVYKIQMIKWYFSIIYHSQMNNQSEALNQIIKNYLRAYISENQIMWTKLFFLAQFIYNNSCNHTTQMSLNQLLHEFNCEIHIDIINNIIKRKISAAKNHIKKLHKLHQKLYLQLVKTQKWMIIYYNICHILKQFKIRNFVKLFIKNFKLKCQKLNFH